IQFKGACRRGSSRSCRANTAAQGHMSQHCDIKEEQEKGNCAGGGAEKPSTTDMHTNTEWSCKEKGKKVPHVRAAKLKGAIDSTTSRPKERYPKHPQPRNVSTSLW
ncbi:hypothetical protein JOB18_014955, partial [Solea senegalensis]